MVNVTWRGKTYVGTLLDCTRHDWAPPRLCDSPTSDIDAKSGKAGRGKRGATVAPRFDDVPTLTQLGLPSDAGKKRSTPNASPWRR